MFENLEFYKSNAYQLAKLLKIVDWVYEKINPSFFKYFEIKKGTKTYTIKELNELRQREKKYS